MCDRSRFKELTQGQLSFQGLTQAREDLRCHERMAPQIEEIVVNSDLLDSEKLLPDLDDCAIDLIPRSDILVIETRPWMRGGALVRGSDFGLLRLHPR